MARQDFLFLSVLIATMSVAAIAEKCLFSQQNCKYTIEVQTGTVEGAGTNSIIGVEFADKDGAYIEIKNLVSWGGTNKSKDYFERGNRDVFNGKEGCLPGLCFMKLNSDGSGHVNPDWYADYVEVTMTQSGKPSQTQHFTVEQWLAVDQPPYKLYAERDNCPALNKKSGYSVI
ncbi:PLAT/LH2 domain-containing protein [Hirschfeldia incana]|nr:PLAT/LH2 domain-containing protein [Hirschfeldia incana]